MAGPPDFRGASSCGPYQIEGSICCTPQASTLPPGPCLGESLEAPTLAGRRATIEQGGRTPERLARSELCQRVSGGSASTVALDELRADDLGGCELDAALGPQHWEGGHVGDAAALETVLSQSLREHPGHEAALSQLLSTPQEGTAAAAFQREKLLAAFSHPETCAAEDLQPARLREQRQGHSILAAHQGGATHPAGVAVGGGPVAYQPAVGHGVQLQPAQQGLHVLPEGPFPGQELLHLRAIGEHPQQMPLAQPAQPPEHPQRAMPATMVHHQWPASAAPADQVQRVHLQAMPVAQAAQDLGASQAGHARQLQAQLPQAHLQPQSRPSWQPPLQAQVATQEQGQAVQVQALPITGQAQQVHRYSVQACPVQAQPLHVQAPQQPQLQHAAAGQARSSQLHAQAVQAAPALQAPLTPQAVCAQVQATHTVPAVQAHLQGGHLHQAASVLVENRYQAPLAVQSPQQQQQQQQQQVPQPALQENRVHVVAHQMVQLNAAPPRPSQAPSPRLPPMSPCAAPARSLQAAPHVAVMPRGHSFAVPSAPPAQALCRGASFAVAPSPGLVAPLPPRIQSFAVRAHPVGSALCPAPAPMPPRMGSFAVGAPCVRVQSFSVQAGPAPANDAQRLEAMRRAMAETGIR